MSLLLDCRKFCIQHALLSCQAVIVGVSGGADSMCLLDILYSLSSWAVSDESGRQEDFQPFPRLAAAHINHGLRGEDADHDEDLVRKYCLERGIPFFSKNVDITSVAKERRISLEQAGRDERYAFFEETSRKFREGSGHVFTAVAHHREDQAETILMNLFRGTGPDGLCGMKPRNQNIIRPLLFASKDEILSYLKKKDILFAEDMTNFDNDYTRNCWRNQILPLIADVSRKDPVQPLLAFSELAGTDKEYFDDKVFRIFEKNAYRGGSGAYGIPCEVFRKEHRAISSRLVRFLYGMRFASVTDLTNAHVAAVLSLAAENSNGRSISLAHGKAAYLAEGMLFIDELSDIEHPVAHIWNVKNGRILLSEDETTGEALLAFDDIVPGRVVAISKTSFDVEIILVENQEQVVYNSRTWYCPSVVLRGAVIRTKKQGDWFSRAGSNCGKPLRRFLTDRKIPSFVRDRMILTASESQVLWIPGVSFSAGFVDEASERRFSESHDPGIGICSSLDMGLYRITILDRNE